LGALTLKSFPHAARGWDVKNLDGIDPTDSYGSETQIHTNRRQILLIEPSFDPLSSNNWISDKGRHIFDGAYKVWEEPIDYYKNFIRSTSANMYHKIIKKCYFLEHFFNSLLTKRFLTIVFGHIGLEILGLLRNLTQKYSFTELKSVSGSLQLNDFETTFQLNSVTNHSQLKKSNLCILIGTNSRFESFRLNLTLRRRILKGGFLCTLFNSLIDLTFPVTFKNSNSNNIKAVAEGSHIFCQHLIRAKNPFIIYNSELLKSNNGKSLLEILKTFSKHFTNTTEQNKLNMLNSTLSEAGSFNLTKVEGLTFKDLATSTIFYFLHSHLASNPYVKKATEVNLLNISLKKRYRKAQIIDQNYLHKNNRKFSLNATSYYYAPTRTFFETEETFCNTEGIFKRTLKLFLTKNILTTWQTLLLIVKYLTKNNKPLNFKSYHNLTYNIKSYLKFKTFIHLHCYVTQHLTSINYYLITKTSTVYLTETSKFKKSPTKLKRYKLKLWLEDFFTGGNDEYSRNSDVLASCSNILRTESKTF
jgi:NADH dehydrogenase/NADH:ubiquinone oxidoreductase subunit G